MNNRKYFYSSLLSSAEKGRKIGKIGVVKWKSVVIMMFSSDKVDSRKEREYYTLKKRQQFCSVITYQIIECWLITKFISKKVSKNWSVFMINNYYFRSVSLSNLVELKPWPRANGAHKIRHAFPCNCCQFISICDVTLQLMFRP